MDPHFTTSLCYYEASWNMVRKNIIKLLDWEHFNPSGVFMEDFINEIPCELEE